jgi:hypothetical protein
VSIKAVVCAFAGHRWTPPADVHESTPVLRCDRCGREQSFGSETIEPEGWMERAGRGDRAESLMDAKIQRRR